MPIQQLRYPGEALQFFAYIPGAIWTVQQLTDGHVHKKGKKYGVL